MPTDRPPAFQEFSFFGQVNGRLGRVTRNDMQHSMVVVQDTKSRKVVGFLEIGMLPKPTSSEEEALAGGATGKAEPAEEGSSGKGNTRVGTSDKGDGVGEWAGSSAIERAPDVAYLANVVVDRNQRRRGIGRVMVHSALEIVRELWPAEKSLYVTVEQVRDGFSA